MKIGFSNHDNVRLSLLTNQQLVLQKKLKRAKEEENRPKIKKFRFHLKQTNKGLARIMAAV